MELKKKVVLQLILSFILIATVLFLPAGTANFWQAWIYCAVLFIPLVFIISYFLKNNPEFLQRRMQFKEKERKQRGIMKFINMLFVIGFLLPGLDYRFGWSNISTAVVIIANAVVFVSYLFVFWVFKTNSYASRIIEVTPDQKVIQTGPYKIVRHPMYLGVTIMFAATPFALGSVWALIGFFPTLPLLIMRILDEEKLLIKDLPGYQEYCQKTRYRLLPFIW